MSNRDFFTLCGVYINFAIMAGDVIHSSDWKSAVEHDGGV